VTFSSLDDGQLPRNSARDRTQPILPLRPGLPERQTHDYERHGTTTLFAALNVLDGTVVGHWQPRHRHDSNQVLNGLKTQSLGQTLQSLGVSKDAAKDAIKKANREVKDAEKSS
jgi:hypothetical protein